MSSESDDKSQLKADDVKEICNSDVAPLDVPATSEVDENLDQHQPEESVDEVDDTDPSKLTLDVSNEDSADETGPKETVDAEVAADTMAATDAAETAHNEVTVDAELSEDTMAATDAGETAHNEETVDAELSEDTMAATDAVETAHNEATVDAELSEDTMAATDAVETAHGEETEATTDMVVEATKTVDSGDELSETCEQAVETESINLTAVNEDAKELAVEPTGSSNTTKEPQTSEPMEQGSNITDNEKVDLSAEIEPEDMEDGELSEDDGDKGEITPTTSSTDGNYVKICLICVVTPNQYNRANYNCNYRPVVQ